MLLPEVRIAVAVVRDAGVLRRFVNVLFLYHIPYARQFRRTPRFCILSGSGAGIRRASWTEAGAEGNVLLSDLLWIV